MPFWRQISWRPMGSQTWFPGLLPWIRGALAAQLPSRLSWECSQVLMEWCELLPCPPLSLQPSLPSFLSFRICSTFFRDVFPCFGPLSLGTVLMPLQVTVSGVPDEPASFQGMNFWGPAFCPQSRCKGGPSCIFIKCCQAFSSRVCNVWGLTPLQWPWRLLWWV